MNPKTILQRGRKSPAGIHWAIFLVLCGLCYMLFVHVDVIETANHSYLLLQSISKGRFLHFYTDVMAHNNPLYYVNNAHYNIVVYLVFAVFQLPLFLFYSLTGLPVNEVVLYFTAKLVGAAFFLYSVWLVRQIAHLLYPATTAPRWAPLFFALWPAAFFSVMVMGQYDTLSLVFMLLAIKAWLQGRHTHMAVWVGVGAACKFFPLLVFVPLVLLVEKRPLHIIKYGIISLWLVLPTTALFYGRTGDMGLFNKLMIDRMFVAEMPAGRQTPLFPVVLLVLFFVAYLWKPAADLLSKVGLWLCLAVLGSFFILVEWHPQWLVLLAPFIVLTTFGEKNRAPWWWLDMAYSAGFMVLVALAHPAQLEANLLDGGLLGLLTNFQFGQAAGTNPLAFYYGLFAPLHKIGVIFTAGGLLCHIILKVPLKNGSPAAKLASTTGEELLPPEKQIPLYAWGVFVVGMGTWFVPVFLTWMKAFLQ